MKSDFLFRIGHFLGINNFHTNDQLPATSYFFDIPVRPLVLLHEVQMHFLRLCNLCPGCTNQSGAQFFIA